MKAKKTTYWTFWGGTDDQHLGQICDIVDTEAKARREVRKCEKVGGARHRIFKVTEVKR